jgi:hypothetical protein
LSGGIKAAALTQRAPLSGGTLPALFLVDIYILAKIVPSFFFIQRKKKKYINQYFTRNYVRNQALGGFF